MVQPLVDIAFTGGYEDVAPGLGSPGSLAPGSRNIQCLGANKKAFKGLTANGKGSRVMFPLKDTYAGLSDYVSGVTRTVGSITINLNTLTDAGNPFVIGDDGKAIQLIGAGPGGLDLIGFFKYVSAGSGTIWADAGFTIALNSSATFAGNLTYVYGAKIRGGGSAFSLIANSIFYNGAGQLTLTGADITGAIASSTLKILLQRNGSYTAADSGPYSAGLTQPSAPGVVVNAEPGIGFQGLLDSPALSLKISPLRSTTGGRGIASPTSAVFACAKQTVIATVPTAQSGQNFWVFWSTFKGFGGVGVHYRLPVMGALQVAESYFARTVTDAVTDSTRTLTSATANFTSQDVNKQVVLSGGGALTTTIESVTNSTTIIMTAPATWSSAGNTAQINAAVASTKPRSVADAVTNGTTLLTSATAVFTQADVNKQVVVSGGSGALAHQTRTIVTVTNATDIVLSAMVAASTGVTASLVDVNGTPRSIELEWQDGDLTSETAWIDDYPPPPATHCFGLNNIVGVAGCYSDASTGPSSTSPGTCIALSLPNFPESFKPTDLLYLPEQVMGILGRPTDSYIYIGCRNSIHQVQYVGGTLGPAAVLTTLWPDVGIGNPHGWCQAYGIIFAAVSRGGLVTIGALGQPDSTFSLPVREYTKDWDPAFTIANWHPDTQQVVFSNGARSVAFSLQTGDWSVPVYYSDFASGIALSKVQTGDQMRLTLDLNGTHRLYNYNQGSGCTFAAFSQWFSNPIEGRTKTIWEIAERVQVGKVTADSLFVSLHRNHRTVSDTSAVMTASSNVLDVTTAGFFIPADVGSYVLVLGAGVAGAPLLARIGAYVNSTRVILVDASTVPIGSASVQNAATSVSGAFMVIGRMIYTRVPSRLGHNVFRPKRRRMREAWSYSVGIVMVSDTGNAQAKGAALYGSVDAISAGVTS